MNLLWIPFAALAVFFGFKPALRFLLRVAVAHVQSVAYIHEHKTPYGVHEHRYSVNIPYALSAWHLQHWAAGRCNHSQLDISPDRVWDVAVRREIAARYPDRFWDDVYQRVEFELGGFRDNIDALIDDYLARRTAALMTCVKEG